MTKDDQFTNLIYDEIATSVSHITEENNIGVLQVHN